MDVKETPFVLIARVKVKPGEYVEKHFELAESIEIEIYGKLATETIDTISQVWGSANIPFKHFKTTNVGYYRNSIFK